MLQGELIIQKHPGTKTIDEQLFEIHVHVIKNRENNWSFASLYASVVKQTEDKSKEISQENLAEFLGNHYVLDDASAMEERVNKLSQKAVDVVEKLVEGPVGEVALILGLDNYNQLKLTDVNPYGPEIIFDAAEIARGVVSYAGYLAELGEEVNV